jgi:hypothetical protein
MMRRRSFDPTPSLHGSLQRSARSFLSQAALGAAAQVSPLLRNGVAVRPLHKVKLLKPGPDDLAHNPLSHFAKLVAADYSVYYAQTFSSKAALTKRAHAKKHKHKSSARSW